MVSSPRHDIVVIGGSAGSLEVLLAMVRELPGDLAASLFVVMHSGSNSPAIAGSLLDRAGELPCTYPTSGERIEPGHVYVAPPDYHLLLDDSHVLLARGPKENGFRPAIDPLFRTAARTFGRRVIGVILSGGMDDGTHGLSLIKKRGGVAVVQDPKHSVVPAMPLSANRNVDVDFLLPPDEIAAKLVELINRPASPRPAAEEAPMDVDDDLFPDPAERGTDALSSNLYGPASTAFRCPECGGALWEVNAGNLIRYRCHVGHGFTGETLYALHNRDLEMALWTAVRSLDEGAALSRRMAEHADSVDMQPLGEQYRRRGIYMQKQANVIRDLLVNSPSETVESTSPAPPEVHHQPGGLLDIS